jgi:hypothetical protein
MPLLKAPMAAALLNGIKSTVLMAKGFERHCGHFSALVIASVSLAIDAKNVAVEFAAICPITGFNAAITAGTVTEPAVTWFLADVKYIVTADSGLYDAFPLFNASIKFFEALEDTVPSAIDIQKAGSLWGTNLQRRPKTFLSSPSHPASLHLHSPRPPISVLLSATPEYPARFLNSHSS